jgi:hypothetical protein
MVKMSDFKNRAEFMAYVRSQKGKNNNENKPKKMKKGKGIMSDIFGVVKNAAINEGEKLIKEKGAELLNKGVDAAVKKIRGKGLLKNIGKTVLKGALSVAPIPQIGRDIGNVVVDGVLGSGLLDNTNMISNNKTTMKKKYGGALRGLSGGALRGMAELKV